MSELRHFVYSPPEDVNTCKQRYEFQYRTEGDDIIVEQLSVTGDKGCKGHPRTISVLLKGRRVNDLPIDDLTAITCTRDSSCPQQLVQAVVALRKEIA